MKTMQNAVTLSGFLGSDIRIRHVGGGNRVARIPLATQELFFTAAGEKQKQTEWHTLVAWNTTAERMQQALAKGTFVVVHGKLVNRQFLQRNGQTGVLTEVVVTAFSQLKPMPGSRPSAA